MAGLLLVAVLAMVLGTIWIDTARRGLSDQAREQMTTAGEGIAHRIGDLIESSEAIARRVARLLNSGEVEVSNEGALAEALAGELAEAREVENVYIGFNDGRFLRVGRVPPRLLADQPLAEQLRQLIDPTREVRRAVWDVRGADSTRLAEDMSEDGFDPRTRPWYLAARRTRQAQWTQPYTFWLTGRPGVTFALPLASGEVIGVDLRLDALERFSRDLVPNAQGLVLVAEARGGILSTSEPARATGADPTSIVLPPISDHPIAEVGALWRLASTSTKPVHTASARWLGASVGLGTRGLDWRVLVLLPRETFLGRLDHLVDRLASLGIALVAAAAAVSAGLGALSTRAWVPVLRQLRFLATGRGVIGATPASREASLAQGYLEDIARLRQSDLQHVGAARLALKARSDTEAAIGQDLEAGIGAVITSASSLRRDLGAGSTLEARVAAIEAAARRVASDVERLAEVGSSVHTASPIAVDVTALVASAIEVMRDLATERNLAITAVLAEDVQALVDGDRLRAAITHLLAHAILFVGPKAQLVVVLTASAREVQIAVVDCLAQLPAEDVMAAVQSAFAASDDRPPPAADLGIGLAMADEQARAAGGHLVLGATAIGTITAILLPVGHGV
jgi:hypothetical protein